MSFLRRFLAQKHAPQNGLAVAGKRVLNREGSLSATESADRGRLPQGIEKKTSPRFRTDESFALCAGAKEHWTWWATKIIFNRDALIHDVPLPLHKVQIL